jgi:hypothetical protein
VEVKEAASRVFLFQFYHVIDMEEVLKRGPKNFDGYMLMLGKPLIGVAIKDIHLFHITIGVQVHHMPALEMMKEKVETGLANYIGEFMEYDASNNTSF